MSKFTDHDQANGVKAATHGALLTLAAMCAIYNIAACRERPAPHLIVNVSMYLSLIALEVMNVRRHCHTCVELKRIATI